MNYTNIYNNLINRGKNRTNNGFIESHHIIPKCMGGSNQPSNLVDLTPEEHYLAHQLLVKMYPDNNSLVRAASMMIVNRPSNKLYGWLRRKFALAQKISQTGNSNSQFGTKWIHSKELKLSKKIPVSEDVPLNWELGRIMKWDTSVKNNTDELFDLCAMCGTKKRTERKFCSLSCSAKYNNQQRIGNFDIYLESMIEDYKNGISIYKCLVNKNLCGTGTNHTRFKKELKNRGLV